MKIVRRVVTPATISEGQRRVLGRGGLDDDARRSRKPLCHPVRKLPEVTLGTDDEAMRIVLRKQVGLEEEGPRQQSSPQWQRADSRLPRRPGRRLLRRGAPAMVDGNAAVA